MAEKWYYAKGIQKHGPLSGGDIKQLTDSGELLLNDLVWKTGMADWQPARTVTGLIPLRVQSAMPPPLPPPIPQSPKPTIGKKPVPPREESAPRPAVTVKLAEFGAGTKDFVKKSAKAIRDKATEPSTKSALNKCRTGLRNLWQRSIGFWIRFSAWYLGVLRRTIHNDSENTEATAEATFPFRDVLSSVSTDRAKTIPAATTLGTVTHWLIAVAVGARILGSLVGINSEPDSTGRLSGSRTAAVSSVWEANEEFEVAASHKNQDGRVAAKMLIELRDDDNFSWGRLESEVEFQFGFIADEFREWKANRIAAGDRFN